ncbi:MATE family efflux transporter [Allocoprobacillus halotolerans]|uniref:Probable multidrug resistance protein NorM n=1 Tax=Allocoprobacillus halotolerans TaxID=2944914 RepID=A0ABY5I5B5_9FIRM|nr:MATE family efflux transporter [Allocoprobacillus halotolerans]UTY40549.1 MATE family efflux transporter [Allocoprobacillus halotolerans]
MREMFSNKDLKTMIVPLFFEQLLVMLVGIADTFIVSFVGETAVSGVSLVNMFNTIFIYLFTALASGGAVVISQYIGSENQKRTVRSSSQLLMFSTVFSFVLGILVLIFNQPLLSLLFGRVENSVMEACVTYLRISAYSYPALAIYNAGAALYRSIGKTSTTMYISLISNVINVVGNILGVFVFDAGVAGVAYPSLIARVFSAIVITVLCFQKKQFVHYEQKDILCWDFPMLKRILNIAVPNGLENGIFQLVKVALSSVVALFGTYQIAANGIAQSIWSLAALIGSAMGPVFITVIGQCMGANKVDEATYYFKKLMKLTVVLSIAWNVLIFSFTSIFMKFYNVSQETKQLVIILVFIHNIFNTVAFPFSGPLSNGLRAAGDVKYTMIVSIASTVLGRLIFSFIFALGFNMGVIGIAFAMCLDWTIRAIIFYVRFRSNKWTQFKVI